jgi:hypothetical protein
MASREPFFVQVSAQILSGLNSSIDKKNKKTALERKNIVVVFE